MFVELLNSNQWIIPVFWAIKVTHFDLVKNNVAALNNKRLTKIWISATWNCKHCNTVRRNNLICYTLNHRFSTRLAAMLQNKFLVFAARFTVALTDAEVAFSTYTCKKSASGFSAVVWFHWIGFFIFVIFRVRIKKIVDKELKTDAMYTLVYCKFSFFFSLLVPSLKESEERRV